MVPWQSRVFGFIILAVFGFLGGFVSVRIWPPSPEFRVIEGREIHLVDLAGVRRASFVMTVADDPLLILRDKQGQPRATLSLDGQGRPVYGAP